MVFITCDSVVDKSKKKDGLASSFARSLVAMYLRGKKWVP